MGRWEDVMYVSMVVHQTFLSCFNGILYSPTVHMSRNLLRKKKKIGPCLSIRREDVISANKDFAVVRNAPGHIAARLRVSEKNFVADHAQSLGQGR